MDRDEPRLEYRSAGIRVSDVYEIDGVLVDADTGEIIESNGDPIERLTAAGLEAKRQIESWERYQKAMKFAAGHFLTDEHPRAETPAGIAKRITQKRRRAKPDGIPKVLGEFELTDAQVRALFECASALDPKLLDALAAEQVVPGDVVDMLVTESTTTYVQFDALRKLAPQPVEAVK